MILITNFDELLDLYDDTKKYRSTGIRTYMIAKGLGALQAVKIAQVFSRYSKMANLKNIDYLIQKDISELDEYEVRMEVN